MLAVRQLRTLGEKQTLTATYELLRRKPRP
jgi:hypothetical protein